ncbi:MAG: aminotransferase class I/II-fold pyridoxal phosphate-dependent enzyme [Candidatus Neomarinimicrobiota bacterium]
MATAKQQGETGKGFHTKAAHTYLDGDRMNRPLSIPIVQATTHQATSGSELGQLFNAGADTFYTRFGNPTITAAAQKVALLEDAEAALVFSSGMGAITTALLTVLKQGDHVVAQRDIFGQTFIFLDTIARDLGIETDFVDGTDLQAITSAARPNTALIYIETPSNPQLKVVDIKAVARIARERNVPLFVDSTFGSPYLQHPLDLGATLVLHSGTKFLGGHSDLMCGVAAGGAELMAKMRNTQILLGNIMDPQAAWLLLRSLKTLGIRVQRQCDTALELARFLETNEVIEKVHYPWLGSSPYYDLAHRQMAGGGGVLSFQVAGGTAGARALLDGLELIPTATSLGGVESLIELPTDLDFSGEELGTAGAEVQVPSNLVRLSVGLEDPVDLIADLQRGMAAVAALK